MLLNIDVFEPEKLLNYPLIMNLKDISDFLNCSTTKARNLAQEKNFNCLDFGVDRILIYRDDFAEFLDSKFNGLNYLEKYNQLIERRNEDVANS